jgi:hypothetical protein
MTAITRRRIVGLRILCGPVASATLLHRSQHPRSHRGRLTLRTHSKSICLFLALIATLAAPIALTPPAYALPAGYFHLRGTVRDSTEGQALRAMDVQGRNGGIAHFIGLNRTTYAKDSQLWKERFPRTGTIDVIRLENKLSGQCLAGPDRVEGVAYLAPCSDDHTLWTKIEMSGFRAVFRRDAGGTPVCLAKEASFPTLLVVLDCSNGFTGEMTWEAYVSG